MVKKLLVSAILTVVWAGASTVVQAAVRPNIVVIMADDMGFSDVGCYGSEIATPNIDALATGGVRFTQFYNGARCCPTRAALLTGVYPHQAGMGHMTGGVTEYPGYKGTISKETPTAAEVLKGAGYATYMVGKWHVTSQARPGGPKESWPVGRGFERFYGTIPGGGSYWDPAGLTRDETPISPLTDEEYRPEGKYYYTTAIGDQAARFVKEHEGRVGKEKPFFMYVAFTAPHWPLHAPEEGVAKYKGKYDAGYAAVRAARLARQKEMGLVPADLVMEEGAGDWEEVKDKAWEARCMEVYAAQVELLDAAVGTVVSALKEAGEFEDTVVMFLADNGGCAEAMGRVNYAGRGQQGVLKESDVQTSVWPRFARSGEPVRGGPNVTPGGEATYVAYGEGWANVSNTPLREYKHWVHEGGISSPLVVHWPAGVNRRGEIERQPGHLVDLMATWVELAGAKGPGKVEGVSLVPAFEGKAVKRERPIFWEHEGNRAVRAGKWKLVAKDGGAWELYDIEADRGEREDLAGKEEGRVKEMAAKWQAWAERANVLPLKGYAKKGAAAAE